MNWVMLGAAGWVGTSVLATAGASIVMTRLRAVHPSREATRPRSLTLPV